MDSEDDALEHARRLATAPALRARGASSAPTELHVDVGRSPEHVGLRTTVGRQGEALAITIEVTARGQRWMAKAEKALFMLVVGVGASVGVSVVALVLVYLVWRE